MPSNLFSRLSAVEAIKKSKDPAFFPQCIGHVYCEFGVYTFFRFSFFISFLFSAFKTIHTEKLRNLQSLIIIGVLGVPS